MALTELISAVFEKFEPTIENKAIKATDILYHDKELNKKVCAHLLKKYGNEVFYNDLDIYITSNNVIKLLIQSLRGNSNIQPRTERQFELKNTKKFLRYNSKYKQNKVISSQISIIFEEIFNMVYSSLLTLDPHTDLGKLQRDIHITGEALSDEHRAIAADVANLNTVVASIQSALTSKGISDASPESIAECTDTVRRFTQEIKEIEKEFQNKHQYNHALSRYYSLLQSITTSLAGHSQQQINTLICTLNCNIALCQSNLGLSEKAFASLAAIPSDAASQSKVYHLVVAVLYIQQNDTQNYNLALEHVNTALTLDPNYHHAFTIKQFLKAHISPDETDTVLRELEAHYEDILSDGSDHDKLSEFYQYHGLINLYANNYSTAINDFQHAINHGYDPSIAKLNIALTLYGEATEAVPKNYHLLAPPINQKLMMNAVDILKEVIDSLKDNPDYEDIRKRAVILYASACSTLGKKHDLVPISDYIYEGQLYEHLRTILLGTSEKLTDDQLSLLSSDDRLFFTIREMMELNETETCKVLIETHLNVRTQLLPAPIYHILLQLCLITQDTEKYWKYRDNSNDYGISGDLLDSMDACAYELDGNIAYAKTIFDRISDSSSDDNILENTLRFYLRNSYSDETIKLSQRMHKLIITNSMYMENIESFYREVTKVFISQRNPLIEKILSELPSSLVSPECQSQLYASYYSATNNSQGLYTCLTNLSCSYDEFTNAFNTALCATRLFKYDEALKICHNLDKQVSNSDEKVKLYWLISDILLLNNKKDDSYLWAKKAHELTIQNPYEPSHQAFFARSFRCNHQEAIGDIISYQKEHPVVVNWIKAFSIPETVEDVIPSIENAIKEFDPNHDSYEGAEKALAQLYRQGIVPINLVLSRYNGDFGHLFDFALRHKLNIAFGSIETLLAECKKVGRNIVTDALTLVIMARHNCLFVLNGFDHVFINFSSITSIQQAFLSSEASFLSDILSWFQTADNVTFEPDGFSEPENQITELFSQNFIACCRIASKHNVPFLYCDSVANRLQRSSDSGINAKIEFVSIPAVCNKMLALNQVKLNNVLYSLLRDCTFISFSAETILQQIRKQNYIVTKELMNPFMFCNTSCDMHSFANVYLIAIKQLYNENPTAATTLACIVIDDTLRIWKQGTYYRISQERFHDSNSNIKARAIDQYVQEILDGIEGTFEHMSEDLSTCFNELSSARKCSS